MRRAVAITLLTILILSGCGNPDQKLRLAAAQSARSASSRVFTGITSAVMPESA